MGSGQFAKITPDLLARKGEARPSDALALVKSFATRHEPERLFNATTTPSKSECLTETSGFSADFTPPTARQSHHVSLKLTQSEFEKLGIVAVKRGINKQRLLRLALDFYLEKLRKDYRSDCQCVSAKTDRCCDKSD